MAAVTSYVRVPPQEPGWRRVTLEIAPFAESIQIALGPFCEKDRILAATSYKAKEDENTQL